VTAFFGSLKDAGRAVALIGASGVTPSALELVDRAALAAVDDWKQMGLSGEGEAVLIGRTDALGALRDHEAETIERCFEEAGATFTARSGDDQESEALYAARRFAYPAVERLGVVLTEDICVPLGRMAEVLERVSEIGRRHDVLVATVAHAGDGNLHPLLVTPRGDEEAEVRAQAAFDEMIDLALEVGGTITGEHGVGLLKREGLGRELSPAVVGMQRAVKAALDPHGILNPGKVLPV
jgi:glycolate oxidase